MMNVIEIIKESQQTHRDWLAYFERNPNSQLVEEYKNIGDIDHHKKCIEKYDQVLAEFEQLQARITELEGGVAQLEVYLSDERTKNAELEKERDLAIAHDRQPYPTAQAYEKVCVIMHRLEAENKRLNEYIEKRQSTSEYEEGQANADAALIIDIKWLKEMVGHISTCLMILKNTKTEEGLRDMPSMCAELKSYVDQSLKESKDAKDRN